MNVAWISILPNLESISLIRLTFLATAGCAHGFMKLHMIRKRAELIPNTNYSGEVMNNEFKLIPNWNFTCDRRITSVLLGVEWASLTSLRCKYGEGQTLSQACSAKLTAGRSHWMQETSLLVEWLCSFRVEICAGRPPTIRRVWLYYNPNDDSAPVAYWVKQTNSSIFNIGI